MRQFIWVSVAFCLVISGCQEARQTSTPVVNAVQPTGPATPVNPDESATAVRSGEFMIGEPVKFENLTIFPILSEVAKDEDRFITLEEGLKQGTVEICEVGARPRRRAAVRPAVIAPSAANEDEAARVARTDDDDPFAENDSDSVQQAGPAWTDGNNQFSGDVAGDVNRLLVLNKSQQPLYLMPGEIIVGGRQDRTIAAETIVEPGDQAVSVEVYCVEHGRWHRRNSDEFSALAALVVDDEANEEEIAEKGEQAARGKFVGKAGNLSKKARYSVQAGEGQGRVWQEVAVANLACKVSNGSGAFTGNYVQGDVVEKLNPYVEHLQDRVAATDRVVGVIVAINGKVEMADVYESTPLFRKLWPKLLKGYALDAVGTAEEEDAGKVCEVDDARKFLDEAQQADIEKTESKGGLVVTRRSSERVKSFSAGMGGMGGGFAGGVHGAAY